MAAKKNNTDWASKRLEPDIRFLLANERTFLAWIRTALAVLAGGIALTRFGRASNARNILSITVIILGGFIASVGYVRFKMADQAIRQGRLPATGLEPLIQVSGIIVVALALVITHLLGIW